MARPDGEAADQVRARDDVLGYLLKHAHLALEHRSHVALADLGVTVRDLGVLRVIASGKRSHNRELRPSSASTAPRWSPSWTRSKARESSRAGRPNRTGDANTIALTDHGWDVFRQAESRYTETERQFTEMLGDAGAARLRQALRTLLSEHGPA